MSIRRCLLHAAGVFVAICFVAPPSSAAVIAVTEASFTAPTTIGFTTEGTWDAATGYNRLLMTISVLR